MSSPAQQHLHDVLARALANPDINTGDARARRLRATVAMIERGVTATAIPRPVLARPGGLLDINVLGHADQPHTLLGQIAAGKCRAKPPYTPLTRASLRAYMDGIADLNRAAGNPPYWWEAWGARPWSKATREPINDTGHITLRRALSVRGLPRYEPYRLRLLAALELLWDTGITTADLVALNTGALAEDHGSIRVVWNPPGRTVAETHVYPLSPNTRAAVRLWLPARDEVVARSLAKGHPASKALFVTLAHVMGEHPDKTPKFLPAGVRITAIGLAHSYRSWVQRANREYAGQPGWPMPTGLYRIARGGIDADAA